MLGLLGSSFMLCTIKHHKPDKCALGYFQVMTVVEIGKGGGRMHEFISTRCQFGHTPGVALKYHFQTH
jgi:hypothetical protein